jgi:alkaline phosphatase D
VDGLLPVTTYYYQVMIDQEPVGRVHSFRTYMPKDAPTAFQVAFGGGAGYTPKYERMWLTIAKHDLNAFLFLGDNVYIDNPEKPDVQRYCYTRRQSRPEYRPFVANTPIYAIWDDHDFTVNDGWGGPKVDEPAWKIPVWKLFKTNWVNPGYGGGSTDEPGCWFTFSIGDVDFIMLDGRYYRHNPRKVENPSMLGSIQKEWLFKTLKESDGTFKVLASPVPWSMNVKPGSPDPWQGYQEEREEIFSFIEDNNIEGVFLISADRHRSDAWKIDREVGYDLYEFESSRLSNMHYHRELDGAIFSYNDKCSFGRLEFNTALPDPEVQYSIWNIDNQKIFSMTLKRSQLSMD